MCCCLQKTESILEAIEAGSSEQVMEWLNVGSDVNQERRYGQIPLPGPLRKAIEAGNKPLVALLLERKAAINQTALQAAAENGRFAISRMLIKANGGDEGVSVREASKQAYIYGFLALAKLLNQTLSPDEWPVFEVDVFPLSTDGRCAVLASWCRATFPMMISTCGKQAKTAILPACACHYIMELMSIRPLNKSPC